MTKTAYQYLVDAFTKAQYAAIASLQNFRLAQENYDAARRKGVECSLEYAIYCDASRFEQSTSKYASDCLKAIESARLLPIEEK